MDNNAYFIKFVKKGDFSFDKIEKVKSALSLNENQLIRKTFKLLNSEINYLDKNFYYVDMIYKSIKLLSVICKEKNFDEEKLIVNRKRIKKSREALLTQYSKYKLEELLYYANKLDEIILDKSIGQHDLLILIKTLIDRKEDFDIIKKLLNTNKGVILIEENELFDYAFHKAIESIDLNTSDIYYYTALLKIFFSTKVDKDTYLKIINKKPYDTNEFANEIYYILHGHKRELSKSKILTKYGILPNTETINIINPNKITTDDFIISIDSDGTKLRDDAFSIKKDGNKYIVGIHIADAAAFIKPDSMVDYIAKNNFSCTYLRNTSTRMFSRNIENCLSLDKNKYRKVISQYVVINNTGSIEHFYITQNVIKVTDNLTHNEADNLLDKSTSELTKKLRTLYELSCLLASKNTEKQLYWAKKENGIISNENIIYKTNKIDSEFMVLYNHLMGKFACDNNIPYNYRTQSNTYLNDLTEKLKIQLDKEALKIINDIYLRSKYSMYPIYHNGLKLKEYTHSSCPLRRYPDLDNQYLLHKFYFNDIDYNYSQEYHEQQIEYYNQRSIELTLMKSEYSRAPKKD